MTDSASGAEDGTACPAGFDYALPPERIAQHPATDREAARMLVVARDSGAPPVDAIVRDLPERLVAGDLLVVNRSRVFPARLRGRRVPEGGAVELLLVSPSSGSAASGEPEGRRGEEAGERWRVLARPARRLREGQIVALETAHRQAVVPGTATSGVEDVDDVAVRVVRRGEGWLEVVFPPSVRAVDLAQRIGETPLPPYIRRPQGPTEEDVARYQTVFAQEPGSIAAPTAGLHLTAALLERLRARGVAVAEVVLHVGPATFLAGQPGRSALAVEPERYEVPAETRSAIEALRARDTGRVVAVGTTTTRALESAALAGWPEGLAETSLVLRPGGRFQVVQGLLTNFHLPGSSLLALVAAFAGSSTAAAAYAAALERGYRFYSYGDAMLVL